MSAAKVPPGFPVQPVAPEDARDPVTCGCCGLTWDDAIPTAYTPAPAARCPFEAFHEEEDEEPEPRRWYASGTAGYGTHHSQVAVVDEGGGHTVAIVYDGMEPARLIAAAPAMLDLLSRLYNDRDDSAEMREVEALLRDLGVTP